MTGRRTRLSVTGGALVLVGVFLGGCTGADPAPTASTPTPTVAPPSTGLPDYHGDGTSPRPTASLGWAEADKATAVDVATAALRLFARPRVPQEQWWAQLRPLLSAQAQSDYAWVDPANVPVTRVNGPGTLVPASTARMAIVHLNTDAGLYAVVLSRTPADPRWVVDRFLPPEEDPHAPDETVMPSTTQGGS